MVQVGAMEASQTLGALLDSVQQGETILITRDGKPVARLTAECASDTRATFQAIEARVAARAAEMKIKFDWEELKKDRDAGRP